MLFHDFNGNKTGTTRGVKVSNAAQELRGN